LTLNTNIKPNANAKPKHKSITLIQTLNTECKGSDYRYACGSWNLKTYSYATCDDESAVPHDESAVGLVETN